MNSLTNSEIPVSIQARPEKTTSRKLNLIVSNPRSSKRMRNWWMRTSAVVLLCAAAAVISPAQTFSVLHRFVYTDGANPLGTLVQGANGTFYGTTINGGTNQVGTVFKITASGTLTMLHNFDGADGQAAFAGLVQATNGNFYGTTYFGGTGGACEVGSCGTVFTMTPGGTLTTLHSFDGTDGGNPFAGLVQATNGNFYGATYAGGASAACTDGCGTIFTITPAGTLTTLYSFCSESDCTDGQQPYGRLVQGTDGNLYGTASAGGAGGGGTVFKITLGGTLTTLYSFCSESDCTDGQQPFAGLGPGQQWEFLRSNDGRRHRQRWDGVPDQFRWHADDASQLRRYGRRLPCRVADSGYRWQPLRNNPGGRGRLWLWLWHRVQDHTGWDADDAENL
jgi:uncharacterized repeat protein (TIGR03803 family)